MLIERSMPSLLSFVIPLFNEEEVFPRLREELSRVLPAMGCPTELILVDDGSRDNTFALMHAWSKEDPSIKSISMSRNFGHQIAVTAGIDAARGDAIIIMDADLQDPPAVAVEMLKGYCAGYDVCYGQRVERQGESRFKLLTASAFYWIMRKFADENLPENVGDFRLISRRVAEDLRRMKEHGRFLRGMITWVGYDQLAIPYVRHMRAAGTTKYPFLKMLKFATTAITSFSETPLRLVTWLGVFSLLFSGALILRTLALYFIGVPLVLGWASLFIMICLFSGLILISIGLVGLYVGKIFVEAQQRPLYLVRHAENIAGNPFR